MIPESKYIKSSITLRNMKLPTDVTLTKSSLIRWLALALGLVNPNESRKTILDLVEILLDNQLRSGEGMDVPSLLSALKRRDVNVSEKTIRYHLLKLERKGILRRKNKVYDLITSDYDIRGIEGIINAYQQDVNNSLEKIRVALDRLKKFY